MTMDIRVLGISGSTRAESNTTGLVRRALSAIEAKGARTELIELSRKDISFCDYCDACTKDGGFRCPKDDDVSSILESMTRADAIIVGSPTYFASVSGKLKALFDRTLPLRRDGMRLAGKVGGAIAVGGSRNGGQEYVVMDIHNWMMVHNMIVVSDGRSAHFGGIAVGRKPGDSLFDEVGVSSVDNLASQVLDTVTRLKR